MTPEPAIKPQILRLGGYLALLVAALHVAISWGQLPVYWGDTGRWLHEVDRFAQGERVYRDFYWPFPPLSIWLVGGLARLVGSDLVQIWTITSILCATIAWTWARFAIPLAGEKLALPVVAIVLPLGLAYSTTGSAPLAMGLYTPAAPVGFLCLLLQLICALALAERSTTRSAIGVGLFGALCVLSKHDFWPPAGVLILASPWLAGADRRRVYLVAWTTSALVLAAAAVFLFSQNGVGVFPGILTGFGMVQESGGRGSPSLETLVVEAITLALCVALVAFAVGAAVPTSRRTAAWTAALATAVAIALMIVWIFKAVAIGRVRPTVANSKLLTELTRDLSGHGGNLAVLLKEAIKLLRQRLTLHALSAFVPLAMLWLVVKQRARLGPSDHALAVLLLVTALALRIRRGMEYSEWTSILIELPIYAFVARTMFEHRAKDVYAAAKVVLVGLLLLVGWQHAANGFGPFSRRGVRVAVATPRGTVRLLAGQAVHYNALKDAVDRVDPSGRRPVFSFGYSGSFNYFLGRLPASPLTTGFRLSAVSDPREAVRILRGARPPVIAIDNPFWRFPVPVPGLNLHRWEHPVRWAHYTTFDRPYFLAVVVDCRPLDHRGLTGFTLYDCPERNPSGRDPR